MTPFEFATAGRIVFGRGALTRLPELVRGRGRRALVVTGRSKRRAERVVGLLGDAGLTAEVLHLGAEPTTSDAREAVARARGAGCDLVVGVGGGSALDLGKAVAALLTNDGDPLDYLEVVGAGRPLLRPSAPYVAVPTTAGTGSEVTRNAVLGSPEHAVKVSLRSPHLLPAVALVDPELTLGLPPSVTAATGFDALAQVVEPFVSSRANPVTDGLAREGMARSARSLRRAFHDGADPDAREDLSLAALLGGLCLANAGLGAVHGFAGPLGGMYDAPHGALCAALLAPVLEANVVALRAEGAPPAALGRFDEVARILTGRPDAVAEDAAAWVRELAAELGIPPLRAYGLTGADLDAVVPKAQAASSMKGNPVRLSPEALRRILAAAL